MTAKEQLDEIRRKNRSSYSKRVSVLSAHYQKPGRKTNGEVRPWVCCFDLETTNLHGNFMGVILCGVVKPIGGKSIIFRGDEYDTWEHKRSDDSQISVDIYSELSKYTICIAHNGLAFDINFLRSRLGKVDVEMPQPKNVDPVRIARRYLRFKFNNLESVGEHFGFTGKTRVAPQYWNEAALDGNRVALDYIVEHCIADVDLLEKVADKLRYLAPKITQWGSDV